MRDSLLHQVAKGDEQAVSQLLDRYGGLVYSLARRFCYQASDLEDAVQDVFVALWQAAGRYDPTLGTEETFVSMVTRRRLIDRRRRAQRQARHLAQADVLAVEALPLPPAAERSELAQKAAECLLALRPEQQNCLRLSVGGLSHEEIASVTGIPLGTVKTHVRRGLIALRDAMEKPVSPLSPPSSLPKPKVPPADVEPKTLGARL